MRAYTLLEVMLVLVLMVTLILLINLALDVHFRQMTTNRADVEEARLARVLLDKIAQDIRSVVVSIREENIEVDTSAIMSIMGLDGAAALLEGLQWDAEGGETDADDEEPMIYGVLPGIYGELDWIQIDTAQLPRGEMYGSRQIRRGTSLAADRLSASKTVRYYLGEDTSTLAMDDPLYQPERLVASIGQLPAPGAPQYGLFRRQLDRQAAQYAMHEGLDWEYEQFDEPIAPEIEWIEFYYFDPTLADVGTTGDWVDHWDMDERLSLPLAVQIVIAIRRPNIGRGLLSFGQSSVQEPVIYSLVVPIPVSVDVPEESEEWDEMLGL
ncbi:MAG: hypothetical protein FWG73_08470 [Planctomycetaceae bacterium]|nr:hypothetical protein [Planctomycetaceae bacterium]